MAMGLYTHLILPCDIADYCNCMLHLKGISKLNVYEDLKKRHE